MFAICFIIQIKQLYMSKIELEYVVPNNESPFKVAVYENSYFASPLHFHPEFELVMIAEGEGLCFCGDFVGPFKPGDIMFYGKSLPHFYLSDKRYYQQNNDLKCKSIYIQFREELLPLLYKEMPGFNAITQILNLSDRGLYFSSCDHTEVVDLINSMPNRKGFDRIILLYTILNLLGKDNLYNTLASTSYENINNSRDTVFLKVIKYINDNFQSNINLSQIAESINMSKSSLCRYFKRITGKSVCDYIIEYRISYACKLIANTDIRISTIAYDSGFNNISHFNKNFLSIIGFTPIKYRQMSQKNS